MHQFMWVAFLPRQLLGLSRIGGGQQKNVPPSCGLVCFHTQCSQQQTKDQNRPNRPENLTATTAALSGEAPAGPVLIRTKEKQQVLPVL